MYLLIDSAPAAMLPALRGLTRWLREGNTMDRPLAGRIILITEDEPLIALDIRQAFEDAGAKVIATLSLVAARAVVDDPNLSGAIVDHALGDSDSTEICQRLKTRNIPFIVYSGFNDVGSNADAHVNKPAGTAVLVTTMVGLLAGRPRSLNS